MKQTSVTRLELTNGEVENLLALGEIEHDEHDWGKGVYAIGLHGDQFRCTKGDALRLALERVSMGETHWQADLD